MSRARVETSTLYAGATKHVGRAYGLDAIARRLGINRARLDVLRKTDSAVAAVVRKHGGRYFAELAELAELVDKLDADTTAMRKLAVRARFPGPVHLGHAGVRVLLYMSRRAGYVVDPADIPPEPPIDVLFEEPKEKPRAGRGSPG